MRRAITIVGILGVLALIAGALLVTSQWFVPRTVTYRYFYGGSTIKASAIGPSASMYEVQPSDTLMGISWKIFGDTQYWDEIADLNNIKAPYIVYPGQELKMPKMRQIRGNSQISS